jgi:hypothetical protein
MFYDITGFDNYEVDPFNCIIRNKTTGYELKQQLMEYPMITLKNNDGKKKTLSCHRLFLHLLSGEGDIVNHKDGNKLNWNINNLELITSKENRLHCINTLKKTNPLNHKGSKEVYVVNIHTKEEIVLPSTNEVARFLANKYNIKINGLSIIVYRIIFGIRQNKIYRDYTFYRKKDETELSEFVIYQDDYMVSKEGQIYSKKVNRLLKPHVAATGHYRVKIHRKNIPVHRIVAEVFIPNPDNLPVVDHIDRDKLNNDVSNLRWVTHQDNNINAERKIYKGIESNFAKPVIGYDDEGIKYVFETISDVKSIGLNRYILRQHIRSETEYNGLYWKDVSIEEYFKLI